MLKFYREFDFWGDFMSGKKIIFYALLVCGIGLCVGGVFVPLLIPVGAAVLAGAVIVAQNLSEHNAPQPQQVDPVHPPTLEIEIPARNSPASDSLEVDLHIEHRKHHSFRLPKTFGQPNECPNVGNNENAETSPGESVQKLHP